MHRGTSIALIAAVLALTGCTGVEAGVPPAKSPLPAEARFPAQIQIEVLQSRSDVVARKLIIRLVNESPASLTVTGVEFRSTQFAEPAIWSKDSTVVQSGRTVDLPVNLGPPACDDPQPQPTVLLEFEVDGVPGTVSASPLDTSGRLPELRQTECFEASVDAVSSIEAKTPLREVMLDGRIYAELDLTATGSGGAGEVTIMSASGTTLFTLSDPTSGAAVPTLPLARAISGNGDETVTFVLQPNRCDPHAIAEDKRGSIFPLQMVAPDGADGIVYVAATPEVRAALFAFFARACGLP